MKKTKPIQFYVSKHMKQEIDNLVKNLDIGISTFIRNAITEKIFSIKHPKNTLYIVDAIGYLNDKELDEIEESIKKRRVDIIFENTKSITAEELEEAGIAIPNEDEIRENIQKRGGIR